MELFFPAAVFQAAALCSPAHLQRATFPYREGMRGKWLAQIDGATQAVSDQPGPELVWPPRLWQNFLSFLPSTPPPATPPPPHPQRAGTGSSLFTTSCSANAAVLPAPGLWHSEARFRGIRGSHSPGSLSLLSPEGSDLHFVDRD